MAQLDDEYVTYDKNDSPLMLNSVDEIKDEVSPNNVLQETHVFLKQAMDTLRDSSMRIKELLEPVDMEDSEAHLIHKNGHSASPFNTWDRDSHSHANKIQQIENSRWTQSFDYDRNRIIRQSQKTTRDRRTDSSPGIHLNAK